MRMRIRVNIFPKDGYKFREKDGTIISDHRGWPHVIRAVTSYRKRNKLPVGNPTDEVHQQACEENPAICFHDDATAKQQIQKASLKGRVLRWFSELIRYKEKHPISFVPDSEVLAREDVCQKCPFNTALPIEGCGSCKKAVKEMRGQILGGRRTFPRLHACGVLGTDLSTEVHLDSNVVDNPELPAHCWKKMHR